MRALAIRIEPRRPQLQPLAGLAASNANHVAVVAVHQAALRRPAAIKSGKTFRAKTGDDQVHRAAVAVARDDLMTLTVERSGLGMPTANTPPLPTARVVMQFALHSISAVEAGHTPYQCVVSAPDKSEQSHGGLAHNVLS